MKPSFQIGFFNILNKFFRAECFVMAYILSYIEILAGFEEI